MYQIPKLNELAWYYGGGEIMELTHNKQFALLFMSVWESFNVIAGNLRRYDLFVVWSVTVGNRPVMLPKRVLIAQFHFGFHIEGHLKNLVLVSDQSCFQYFTDLMPFNIHNHYREHRRPGGCSKVAERR